MDLRAELKGDLALQRRFQTAGDRMREAVSGAIWTLLGAAQDTARSRAPRGKTGRLREGIIRWADGNGWYKPPNNGNALTNEQIARFKEFTKDSGSIFGVVASTWYTGRFFERGISKRVWVGRNASAAAYNAYNASFRRTIRSSMRGRKNKDGTFTPATGVTQERYELAEKRAIAAGDRAKKKALQGRRGHWRNQRTPQRPFMAPARDAISGIYESVIADAVEKAVSRGG
ncbi:MAG: hypothetical protein RJA59_1500 [Pseudomonadota bacterium]